MHISLTIGAILLSFVHQFCCENKLESHIKGANFFVPSAPFNLTVKNITSNEIHLSWAKPLNIIWQQVQAQPLFHHNDILANKDTVHIGPSKDLEIKHDHQGKDSILQANDAKIASSAQKFQENSESYQSVDDGVYRRRKRRRDLTSVPSDSSTSPKDTTSNDETTEVLQDDAGTESSKKSGDMIDISEDINPEEEHKKQNINYVLYYEEGASGESANSKNDDEIFKSNTIKEVVLEHQNGKDGIKGVKYALRDLKPYTNYRIWVRAFYAAPLSELTSPPSGALGLSSENVTALTDVPPPSAPVIKNLFCEQPPGTIILEWSRPESWSVGLDAYLVTLKRTGVGGIEQQIHLETNKNHIDTVISLPVDISNNVTYYEVTLQAATRSIVDTNRLINGSTTESYQVTMTRDCHPDNASDDISGFKPEEEQRFYLGTLLGIVIVLIAGTATFLALLILYRWGCASIFKRCLPMSSLLLRDGTTSDGSEGCGEGGTPGKADHSGYSKKIVSPTHTVVFWGGADGAGVGGNSPPGRELLWDESHPPVASDNFLAHTAALHADGDIGFGKEYDLIQSKSAMLGYTSNHSQHPDNRHKNRYLNITAYDHSRVCLLPSSCCSCEPGKEHRKSCASSRPVSGHQPAEPVSLHGDYVNANFIDGIAAELSPELSKFILAQNERRKAADRKKLEINTVDSGIVQDSSDEDSKKRGTTLEDIDKIGRESVIGSSGRAILDGSIESKIPLGFETVDPMVSMAVFDTKMPINMGVNKEKLSLDLNVDKKPVDVSNNTCRLSINLDKKEEKHDDVKSEKSVKIGKKRSTSADTRDIVVDKKGSSRGHSKNSSVVVNINQDSSPSGGAPKIEGAFLNIEFSGIVDSERELQKAREAERIEEANRLAKEAAEESMDDLDRLYVQIDGSPQRVKSSWLLDRKRYIGTQGPTPSTLPAFWRMVWDHHVAVIVMITNLVERGRRKCDMYWPKDGTETYGAIQVSTLHEDVMATYTVRMFQIKNTKVNLRRSVVQYHYTVWPDHGTPEHPLAVLRFREAARRAAPPQAGAVLVHCSAGVGRTGTYIVLDAMLNHLRLTGSLNVFGFLCHVRSQRNFLVQTEEQYVFIHDALLEAIQSGDTEVPAEKAKDYLKTLLEPFPEGHRPDGSGAPDRRIGLYGAPLTDSEDVVPQNGVTAQLPIDDFGLWNSESTAERFGDDRTLDECRNELVSVSLQNRNRGFGSENPSSVSPDCNGADTSESKNSAKKSTEGKGDSEERDAALTKSPKSITAGSGRMIDFNDKNNKDDINGSETAKNDDSGSMSSANAVKSDHSTSYEKFNGTHAKTGDESKATSVSDEEADLLYGKARTNGNSKDDGNNGNQSASGDTNTVTSSISSDTNRLNNLSNFRDRPGYSPVVGSQDGAEVYRKERNARGKGDDNYEALGGGNRVGGGGPDSCFAGGHRFACQRRDSGGKKARNLLEHQFNLVCAFEPSKFHTVSADKQVNSLKNRKGAVLPVESGRVHLIPKPGEEGSDYINATWLQGHRSLREYVVTQHPLSNTVDDLYRLLWDHSCQLVVVLTDCDEDPECEIFWPTEENQEINAYNYCIRYMSQERHIAKRKPKPEIIPPGSIHKSEELTPNFILASNRPSSPLHSPSSGSCNKSFALKLTKVLQKSTPGSPNSDVDSNKRSPTGSHTLKSDDSTKQNNAGFYRRQSSADNQDEERLIPKSDEPPSLEGPEELKKLNSEEKSDGYAFERSELLHIDTSIVDNSVSPKVSPNKRQILNGDICGNVDDNCSKKQSKSPSKISLKSLRLHSPVLKSPTKFKFELGNRGGNKTDEQSSLKAMPLEVVPGFDPKFEMVEYKDSSQLRDGVEEIGRDCIITTTHMTMNSIQDDYELKVCLIQCPKWLADLDYDENSDTDEGSDDDEFELETKALDFVIERRLKAYRGVFGLPEYLTKCQDEFKNSPVVVIDKNGGARAASLCTLSGAIRRSTRDVYSLAKLHHGRRAGAWRRPSDLRALYEALAAYQHDN